MAAKVEFTPVSAHKPGVIATILARSYEPLIADGQLSAIFPSTKWPAFDGYVFDNLDTFGRSVFVTCADSQIVGFASWDPRGGPACGVIGHNCVLPEQRGRGYGRLQIQEVLRRFRSGNFRQAIVTTGDDPFFLPAQRMYQACGFVEVARFPYGPDYTYGTIRYELDLVPTPATQPPIPEMAI
jgi:GNAT superfamily N-acetyltransferase